MFKILFVEDEKQINDLVSVYLKAEGYDVTSCFNGVEGLSNFLDDKFDMVISDVMMPQMDGFTLVQKIREVNANVPIVLLTAKEDKLSKQYGYKLGVDDYITKPFDIDELMLKIKAIFRRVKINSSNKLEIGNLVLDNEEHTAYLNGEEIMFTVREFDLLFKLLSYPIRKNVAEERIAAAKKYREEK